MCIGDKIFDVNFGLFLKVVKQITQAFIDYSLLLLVQFGTVFCAAGGFSDNGIVADKRKSD